VRESTKRCSVFGCKVLLEPSGGGVGKGGGALVRYF